MKIKNINPAYGDTVIMDSVSEMERLIGECGYRLPDDGLREGRDYEVITERLYSIVAIGQSGVE